MKRRSLVFLLTGIMCIGMVGCGGTDNSSGADNSGPDTTQAEKDAEDSDSAEYVLKLCTEQVDGDPIDDGCDKWAELVSEATDGAVKIEVYPSSQLGAKADLIEMAMMGQNVCTIADGSYLMDYVSDFGVVMGPYLFDNWEDMYKITASDWWAKKSEELTSQGLQIISTNWVYGERELMTKKEIKSLEDLKGLKIRVPNNDISIAMFNSLGSAATPMALNDVYTSLSQGVVDGVENPLTTLYNNDFQEVCKYVTMTNHQMTFSNFVVGADYWKTIPEEYQKVIMECSEEAAEYNNGLYMKQSEEMVAALEEDGCTITELDDAVQAEFKNACLKLYEDYEADGTWTKGSYEEIQNIISK